MFTFIFKGGWVMAPIIAGSIVGLALIIDKFLTLRKIRIDAEGFSQGVFNYISRGEMSAALNLCFKSSHSPLARIYKAAIENNAADTQELEKYLERLGNREIHELEKRLGGLASIIGIEPLLGFLGTITGLIRAFMTWENAGSNITVNMLAGGIYEAMITTAAGLMVAVPYYLAYNYFVSRIKYISHELNDYSMQLVEVLGQQRKRAGNENKSQSHTFVSA